MQDTIELIKQWGADRGITINGTHRGQWYKLASEYGELCDNLAKGKCIKDDIGDMFVVLVMISEIGKVDLDKAIKMSSFTRFEDADVYDLVGWLHSDIGESRYTASLNGTYKIISTLTALAEAHDTTLDECIDIAYQDIKSRKGYLTADGVFVKDVGAGCRIGGGE
jgi:hypothetical protein